MYNQEALKTLIAQYKQDFDRIHEEEIYKWKAVEWFQINWNGEEANERFAEMLKRSLSKSENLLASNMYYPRKMIEQFAQAEPAGVKIMFERLFDLDVPLQQRCEMFMKTAEQLRLELGQGEWKNHYQDARALSVYLFFRYPEKYYLFKSRQYRNFATRIAYAMPGKTTGLGAMIDYYNMCDEILPLVEQDEALLMMSKKRLGQGDYRDEAHHMLIEDIVYFGSTLEKGAAPEAQAGAMNAIDNLSERGVHYWIFSPGEGARLWEEMYAQGVMAIGWDQLGDLRQYPSRDAIRDRMKTIYGGDGSYKMNTLANWEFVHALRPNDIVYAKKGLYEVVGRGVVTSDYEYLPERQTYNSARRVRWTHKGSWPHPGQAVTKTLTDITPYTEYVNELEALIVGEDAQVQEELVHREAPKPYTRKDFLDDVFISEQQYLTMEALLLTKMNLILEGPPGVGNTYAAKRLAYSLMGVKDESRVMMVQFHQSYGYEDFVLGYRPTEQGGFDLNMGPFYQFCKDAELDLDHSYFFIIDEINRGNISKIFGELMMLIEKDKRGQSMRLMYRNEQFSVPRNLYIIGLMNTADRSLALIDYALRRRFAFVPLAPAFDSEGFRAKFDEADHPKFGALVECVMQLNNVIRNDSALGEGFLIGHSYFCPDEHQEVTDAWLSSVVNYELIPLLNEYWYDEPSKVEEWTNRLRGALR